MVLTFDSNLLASDGQDLQSMLPGFGKPSAIYQKACFQQKAPQFCMKISTWLPPRLIVVKTQPLLFKELCSIIKHELKARLTCQEQKEIADLHQKAFKEQAPPNMYTTRKDAFSPNEHPNWFFQKKKGMWLLEAGK